MWGKVIKLIFGLNVIIDCNYENWKVSEKTTLSPWVRKSKGGNGGDSMENPLAKVYAETLVCKKQDEKKDAKKTRKIPLVFQK